MIYYYDMVFLLQYSSTLIEDSCKLENIIYSNKTVCLLNYTMYCFTFPKQVFTHFVFDNYVMRNIIYVLQQFIS